RRKRKSHEWPKRTLLEKTLLITGFESLDNFADVLRAVAGANQQSVRRFYHDKIVYADGSDKFAWHPEEIAFRVQGLAGSRKNIVTGLLCLQFVDGCPGADVAPSDFRGDDEDARLAGGAR